MPTEDACTLVGKIGVVVVAVSTELAALNDCATLETGVYSESAEMGRVPPSAAAMLVESWMVMASDCYNVVLSARTKDLRVRCRLMNKVMLWKGARQKWVLCRLVGCNAEIHGTWV